MRLRPFGRGVKRIYRLKEKFCLELVEAAGVTWPYKSIAYSAKRPKCPRKYPQHACDEMRTLDSVIRISVVPTQQTVSRRRWSPGATGRPALREVDVSISGGDRG